MNKLTSRGCRRYRRFSAPIFIVFVLSALGTQVAYSLGLGEVKLNSYIGQSLSASIPVLSASNANAMSVEITPFSGVALQSYLQTRNGQTSIRIVSSQPINEPYVQFSIKVTDQAQVMVREFTALLDIKRNQGFTPDNLISTIPLETQPTTFQQTQSSNFSDTLGPYQWAQKGNIPSRFGPVLDGQSLWRVARRINSAMGVSIDQMMWALYTSNPDAFSANTIESLLAGVYLDIPSLSVVSSTGNNQAKENLNNVSANKLSAVVNINDGDVVGEVADAVEVAPNNSNADDISEDEQIVESGLEESDLVVDDFKLSGLNDISDFSADNDQNSNEQAIETINVLSVTVGNLTQELIRKDKRIEFLEEKVFALEKVAELDSDSSGITTLLADTAEVKKTGSIESKVAPTKTNIIDRILEKPWFLWLSLLLVGLLGAFLFRNKIKQLNLFGRVDDIDFPTQMEYSVDHAKPTDTRDFSKLPTVKKSDMVRKEVDIDQDSFVDISVQYYDDHGSQQTQMQEKTEEIEGALTQKDFEAKLEILKQEENHTEIASLLDLARNKVIDDDRYYFEYLRYYFNNKDEDKFYAFYDEIEYAIQHFPEDWNRQISEMVIQLGQKV